VRLTFPRDFLEPLPFQKATVEPVYGTTRSPTRGALQQAASIAADYWEGHFETYPMREADAEEWKAWLASLRGGLRTFRMWDPVREFARAYPQGYAALTRHGGGSFADGTATLTAIGGSRDTVTLATLPSTFVLLPGDRISIPFQTTKRCLVRVVEGATASAGTATVGVEPVLPLAVAADVTVDLKRAHCVAVVDAKSISGPWQTGRKAPVMFRAESTY